MSDSPNNHLDQISSSQTGKERKANEIFDSTSPATFGARRTSTTAGLTLGFYGGKLPINGVDTPFPASGTGQAGTAAVAASSTRYLECSRAGAFSVVSTPTPGAITPLATMVTDANSITTYTDNRCHVPLDNYNIVQRTSFAVTSADVTLTAAQARCRVLETTGTLTGNRSVIVPNGPQMFAVTNSCSGAFTLTVKTASGTGIVVAAATTALLMSDGTNVVLISSSVGASAPSNPTESMGFACSDETTALTTGTGKLTFRMPYAFTLSAVRASLVTAQTSGSIFTVDINENGTSLLSTKLTIDNTEKTSTTAATAAVISDSSIADDAEITVDIDQIGDGTAKGLKIWMVGTRT